MNEETQKTYDLIRQSDSWFLGLGRLVGPAQNEQRHNTINLRSTANRDPELCLAWWQEEFGGNLPACFEFDLTQQWGMEVQLSPEMNRRRVYEMAGKFADRGGIPWFRDHSQNHATKNQDGVNSGIPFHKTHYDVSVRLEGVLAGGEGREAFISYYKQLAEEIKAFGRPCVLRLFHEANGMWFWWGGQPDNYKKIWREVFDIFQNAGVRNAIWCYNISRYIKRITPPNQPSLDQVGTPIDFYAGDDYVDLLSFDAWFDAPHITRESHKACMDLHVFGGNRPIFIGELGAKAREDFFRNLPEDLLEYPRFRGINFWLENRSFVSQQSDSLTFAYFKNFLSNPRVLTLEKWNQITKIERP